MGFSRKRLSLEFGQRFVLVCYVSFSLLGCHRIVRPLVLLLGLIKRDS